ncbi:MAG: TonB-dependent receptor [Muribaculaceae bacterium]|nr:TonB-dependent receptor [Muribaculaceae bacterium]
MKIRAMKKYAMFIFSCLACSATAWAQEPSVAYTDSVPDFDDMLLDEVVVTGQKPLIQTSADKVTYNMDEDPSAQTATVSDALRKVPMISVDADGNIKLKGESNFQIYMNGKPNPALTSNYKDILKAMPASSIKKIEVITEPGAKYDAEGVGGIINIITETKSNLDGWTATINATGTRQNVGGGLNAMAKFNKVSLNLNYNHSYNMVDGMRQVSSVEYLNNPVDHLYRATTGLDIRNNFDYGGMQMSWEPNDDNLFTASANLFNINTPINTLINYEMLDNNGDRRWGYNSNTDMKMKYLSYTLGANWQHNFHNPNHNIVFLYQYNHNNSTNEQTNVYDDYFNYPDPLPGISQIRKNPDNEHTFQVDYTLPIGSKHVIETGAKYIMRRNYGNSYQYNSDNGIDWIYDETASVRMKQHQDVVAVYGAYTGTYGAWMVKGGLRYEYAYLSSRFHTPGYEDFSQNLNDLVPNAMVAYTFPDYSSLRLSYQMRITRPSVEQLNPFRQESTPLTVEYGNPELISQKANNIALTYSNFSLPVQLNLTLSYNYTDKMILQYRFLDAAGIYNNTYGNYGQCNQGSLFAYIAYPITNNMRLSVNAGADYKDYKSARVGVHNHGWGWNAGGDFTYQMPWDLELSAYGGAGCSGASFQGKSSVWSYHGIGITKSLLKENRMRITLTATNFFKPTMDWNTTDYTQEAINRTVAHMSNWNIGATVSIRLGNFNQHMKTTSKSINNDDINQSSGSSTGIGSGMPTMQ